MHADFFQECQDSLLKRRVQQGGSSQLRSLCDEGVVEVPGWRDVYNALCARCMDERGVGYSPNARKEWEKVNNVTMARARLRAADREHQSQEHAASRARGGKGHGKGR